MTPQIGQVVIHDTHECWMRQALVGIEQFVLIWGCGVRHTPGKCVWREK